MLTNQEKEQINEMFKKLDPKKFWTLKATEKEAAKKKEKPKTVEEKMIEFARSCNYRHPSQTLILDLGDDHWESVFTTDELSELEEDYGNPLLLPVAEPIGDKFTELLEKAKAPKDVYKYGQRIEHDPIDDPLLAWLTLTFMSVSLLFMNHGDTKERYLEADTNYGHHQFTYGLTDYFNKYVFMCHTYRKEKSSQANATASNCKRKLSAVEEVERKIMGRKMDALYIGGEKEVGCMEVGSERDQTKEWKDSMVKMPVVMQDQLREIVQEAPQLKHKVDIVGYSIHGNQITMLDMDVPKGYVSRIRRIKPLTYPTCSEDFVLRLIPLIELAIIAKEKMEKTLHLYRNTLIGLQMARHTTPVLPLCPFSSSPSANNSTTGSTSSLLSSSINDPLSSSTSTSASSSSKNELSVSASKRQKQTV
ncbi:hypothetical protein INT45_007387 [Circinella minor]|uniref:Uncharacterized protein n=1 Tax=Circinella minor TaxID=1195481 RepID=A0A8H7RW90_9FUNG|nr:hypothetical protein INT45_007387 [Circinella minor]